MRTQNKIKLKVHVKVDMYNAAEVSRVKLFLRLAEVITARSKPRHAVEFLTRKDHEMRPLTDFDQAQAWLEFNTQNAEANAKREAESKASRVIDAEIVPRVPTKLQSPVCIHRLIREHCSICRAKPGWTPSERGTANTGYHSGMGFVPYKSYQEKEAERQVAAEIAKAQRMERLATIACERVMPLTRQHGLSVEDEDSSGSRLNGQLHL